MKILLTGDERGFIGPWLQRELRINGHSCEYWRVDVREPLEEPNWPDAVVHLAARVGRLLCEQDGADVIATNVAGTMHVAKACDEASIPLVYVSTSEAPYGRNLYGLTKAWGEQVARLYHPETQIQRLYMPYGPGHPPGHGRAALTNFLWNARRGEELLVHEGTERAWCWIGDTVRAMRIVLENGHHPGTYDIGRVDNSIPMVAVALAACELVGAPHELIQLVPPPRDITAVKTPDVEALYALGWTPEIGLAEGMRNVLDWLDNSYSEGVPA